MVAAGAGLLICMVSLAAASENVLPNGDFENLDGAGRPAEWAWVHPGSLAIVEEEGNSFLRVSQEKAGPHVFAETRVPVDPGWVAVRVRAKMRARDLEPGKHEHGYQNGRIQFLFENEREERVGPWPECPALNEDTGWAWLETQADVPDGAKWMRLQCAIFAATGVVDFDDVTVVPVPAGEPPAGERFTWGEEPVEELTSRRGRICLNGIWKFRPAPAGGPEPPPDTAWGTIRVPGDWAKWGDRPTVLSPGRGPAWSGYDGRKVARARYRRDLAVPAAWAGRAVVLELERVSTDARVFVDGREAGTVNWPYGSVDLTGAVTPGKTAVLEIEVVAVQDREKVAVFMGPGQVLEEDAELGSRGLIGDVILHSRPKGAHISDVFVQTSTRRREIVMDVGLAGIPMRGEVKFLAELYDEAGKLEKKFETDGHVVAKNRQKIRITSGWKRPRLWDLGKPNLYTLKLTASGSGIADEYPQVFGFREFWIEGRKFFLNGTEIRLRPVHSHAEAEWGSAHGTPAAVDAVLDGCVWAGYNIMEIWPWDHYARGTAHWRDIWYERADRKGFLVMGVALSMADQAALWKQPNWETPGVKREWQRGMRAEMERYRNHPSVVIWATSANFFGHGDDQNPRRIGNKKAGWLAGDEGWERNARNGEEAVAMIKEEDPTRPVLVHQGGPAGEIYALNSYLNMIPLQEREEWYAEWARTGDMPYVVIEGGTPLHCTFMRKRNGGGWGGGDGATFSEPLMTEFCAIYLGREAYGLERDDYRRDVTGLFKEGTFWGNWQGRYSLEQSPAAQKILRLFGTNSFRSWRTEGMTGGFVPWNDGHGWTHRYPKENETVDLGPFRPGSQGTYHPRMPRHVMNYLKPEGNTLHPSAEAIVRNNRETLAWIAGKPGAFAEKGHSFRPGQKVVKQVVVINDARERLKFRFKWEARLAGAKIASGKKSGKVKPAENLFFPVEFSLPAEAKAPKADGEIVLTAAVGAAEHHDRFPFRVLAPEAGAGEVAMHDPAGKTTAMLRGLGYGVNAGEAPSRKRLFVIGREALSSGGEMPEPNEMPAGLEEFVASGGRVLVFAQHPGWIEEYLGFRTAAHVSRRVFPVDPEHPVAQGLDAEDLRDWSGEGTLVEPRPDYIGRKVRAGIHGSPWYGWHWGNRGSVASRAVEKPHHGGWRPILECEFDLACSPLLELDYGRGRVVWTGLDLEDNWESDPAARALARRIVDYAATAPLSPRVENAVFLGNDREAELLDSMGLVYRRADALPGQPGLAVAGSGRSLSRAALVEYLEAGGRLFVLANSPAAAMLGLRAGTASEFRGSLAVPAWEETRGLSASDLRWRTFQGATLFQESGGIEVGADGLLARVKLGRGVAILFQASPDMFDADTKTYFRYTRWRTTRTIAQLLANLGASFEVDARVFRPRSRGADSISLAGAWRGRMVEGVERASSAKDPAPDPGVSKMAESLVARVAPLDGWMNVDVPGLWKEFNDADGEAVFRREVDIPGNFDGRDLVLSLGAMDDFDSTYFNGVLVGSTGGSTPDFWSHPRKYRVPAALVKQGKAVIAVRVFDHFGGGGLTGPEETMRLELDRPEPALGFYHRDYWTDFAAGDDPYRYERW